VEPQLVLEMYVLRLATLPPLLPVDEILRRLESLGGDDGGGRGRAAAPAPKAPGRPESRRSAPAEDLWERFLARVRDEKVSLYMALVAGRPAGMEGDTLRIGLESEAMRREVSRKDTLDRLHVIAREVAGRELRVEIGPMPVEQAGDTPLARARRRTEETLTDPLVQAAVEIFGAEVRGVRDRRT